MSRGDFGYNTQGGSSQRPYRDEPGVAPPREYRDNPFDSRGNRGNAGGAGYQGTEYNSFNELVDTISSNIFTINNSANTLEKSLKDIGTPRDCVQLRDKLHKTEQRTNLMIRETMDALGRMAGVCSRADRQQKLQHERLTNEFRETIQRYNTFQKKVADKVKSSVILTNTGRQPPKLVDFGDEEDSERRLVESEERRAQMLAQEEAVEVEVALLQEREQHIRQLESDVLDINEIFRDLGTMVHEQGSVIDSIENNVTKAADDVEGGRGQLERAAQYQRKARKKMCILVAILLVIAGILVLVIALTVKHK